MDQHVPRSAIHFVCLELGVVVSHIVYSPYTDISWSHRKETLDSLARLVRQKLPVREGKVSRRGQRGKILLTLIGVNGSAGELTIREFQTILPCAGGHHVKIVIAHLIPKPPGA